MELKGMLVRKSHIGILRPRVTAVFLKPLHQLCAPGQDETPAPPKKGDEEGNGPECGGGGAPAGPSEEEESDGRQLGAQHPDGYAVLSLLRFHYVTICNKL